MNFAGKILIGVAEALMGLWNLIKALLTPVFHALDYALEAVLTPLLGVLNPICNSIGDGVYAILSPLPTWAGLTIISILVGVLMLIAFRYLSNQKGIGKAKDDIKANLLALKLYKDELRVTFIAQWRLFKAICRLQRYMLTPMLILILPMMLGLAQMGIRYQWRPLHPGETSIIEMALNAPDASGSMSSGATSDIDITLEPSPGIEEAVAVPGGGKIVWRILTKEPGRHTLRFLVAGQSEPVEKELIVSNDPDRVSMMRVSSSWFDLLLHPVESRLPASGPIASITIQYPDRKSYFNGTDWWVLTFFIISMVAALILKPVFKVKF